jgi:hypothetical protein
MSNPTEAIQTLRDAHGLMQAFARSGRHAAAAACAAGLDLCREAVREGKPSEGFEKLALGLEIALEARQRDK